MLKGIFSPDNVVFRFFLKLGTIWWLNILWLLCSLPLFTIGASTTALIYSCMKLHQDEGYPTANFFKSFQENFRQATIIWLLYAGVGALLAWDLVYWNGVESGTMKPVWAASLAIALLYGISFLYVFALQAKFVNSVGRTIAFSLLMPFRNLKETLLMVIAMGAVLYLNVATVFALNFFTLNLGIGLLAYLFAAYFINIFKRYIPAEEAGDCVEEEE